MPKLLEMTATRIGMALALGLAVGCAKAGRSQEAATLPPPPNMTNVTEGAVQDEPAVRAAPVPAAVEGATLEQAIEAEATKTERSPR